MSTPASAYAFLPWLRQGIADRITAPDPATAPAPRASVRVELSVTGQGLDGSTLTSNVAKEVELFGPGDITGLDRRAVVRTEPHDRITNFEPNYLAFVEFYDEDFPWRYTPAAPDPARHRLRPWIMLVVLAEEEFTDGPMTPGRPLPCIRVTDATLMPPAEQLDKWAHVHVNRPLTADAANPVSGNQADISTRLRAVLNQNPDLAYSRLLSPRRLEENRPYHAFIVPTFESGRLAGLGFDPSHAPNATAAAAADYTGKEEKELYPYYYRWYFRTGGQGDFEYLVRLLKARPVDLRVEQRDMDVQAPGANVPGITDASLGGVLKLGGALRVPRSTLRPGDRAEAERQENWASPYPHPFQRALASLVNLADDYGAAPAAAANANSSLGRAVEDDPDPLITPPIYGRWHALTRRLLVDRDGNRVTPDRNWVHQLNLDPRYRVPAGFGTGVVQKNQEDYMNAAWEQVGDVLEANRRIRLAQLAKEMSYAWYRGHVRPLTAAIPDAAFTLTTPVHSRVVNAGYTVSHQVGTSRVTPAVVSAPMRRVMRPRGRLVRSLPFTGISPPSSLLTLVNEGIVTAAPAKTAPSGAAKLSDVVKALTPAGAAWFELVKRYPWLPYLVLAVALLIALLLLLILWPAGAALAAVVAAAGFYLFRRLRLSARAGAAVLEEEQTPESVDRIPPNPGFKLIDPAAPSLTPRAGTTEGEEASRFRAGLKDSYRLRRASSSVGTEVERKPLDLPRLTQATITALNPQVTIPQRLGQTVSLPPHVREKLGETLQEVMHYPEFDTPMYKPLVELSTELFLPNLPLIEDNSITILEPNQKFIEAYMVGLNHEMARELLWREYPTDQRGSYFRQFWDVRGYLNRTALDREQLRERLRDIPPIHLWPGDSALGDHEHRRQSATQRKEVVLVIRGELLKKYPTAVIYAHRAGWQRRSDGTIDPSKERRPVALTPAEEQSPPDSKLKTPLYEAKIEPDVYFFGFDLAPDDARGGTGQHETDDPGWFFVVKERPGEPRFGLDVERGGDLNVWNDLAWPDVQPGGPSRFIPMDNTAPNLTLVRPSGPDAPEKLPQYLEDMRLSWGAGSSSADLAYILFQAPVRVAIHAAEMLPA